MANAEKITPEEALACIKALTEGWVIEFYPPSRHLTDAGNEKTRWLVKRSQAFPSPYGCYVYERGERVFKNIWTGPHLPDVLRWANEDMEAFKKDRQDGE